MTAKLVITGASKAFPGVQALDDVSLTLEAGSIHALLGENGAGKSTLIKIITGVHRPDSGTVLLDGEPMQFFGPHDALAHGISAVHQERNLIPRFSVAENIMLERLPTRAGLVDYGEVREAARRFMAPLGLEIDPDIPVRNLSVARMQLVEIAKALSLDARLLVLDEPTASITPHETETLFRLLRELRDKGVAILFVSHKLDEVFELCDSVTVLRDGRNACASRSLNGLDRSDVVRLMIGRDETAVRRTERTATGEPVLALRDVATDLGHRNIDLEVRAGEIVGLYGLVGAGRTELAKAVIGAAKVTSGEVQVGGRSARIDSVATALSRYRIGYVSEDRKHEGLILMHSVRRNVAVTVWRRIARALGWLPDRAERDAVTPYIERLQVRTPSLAQPVSLLSGGNQQKVSVAKWLAAQVRVLIVDEPTVGIDIQTKVYLHELIHELAASGTAILLISSDMPEMISLADRIVVMADFEVVGELDNTRDAADMSEAIMARIHKVAEVA
ncbi:sugar ABC transporter ATP-binding protein [Tranquillimonas alkanivorans]|uniref:Monosaccharide ABC transporter ATP-binding protein, CUT2 family n=1 Tax=Tranquillimonas alkanivorans TaxID=441119 RepID=A0A1I5VKP0_9RHOB|nr:sugar ABC transporter ATP-binding protein [Tranquillimonas alkanivorans]SFQ07877.1 monosaccharide ABC transporter ATP-binding protein, CUT2 family [Tranquillimonas alkanivorans]